jgi:hypothetical protein
MKALLKQNQALAKSLWLVTHDESALLRQLTVSFAFSVATHDLTQIDGSIYVTHSGLLALARRRGCSGIRVRVLSRWCDAAEPRWIVEATVFTSSGSMGFSGLGEATTSTVLPSLRGCELRIAETRAVNRALRKAYGIGLCSVEELGAVPPRPTNAAAKRVPRRAEPTLEVISQVPLRDQLRQLIRQHKLDPILVKQYALRHCAVKSLRDASREQVADFIALLKHRVTHDYDALVADLNHFASDKAGQGKEAA